MADIKYCTIMANYWKPPIEGVCLVACKHCSQFMVHSVQSKNTVAQCNHLCFAVYTTINFLNLQVYNDNKSYRKHGIFLWHRNFPAGGVVLQDKTKGYVKVFVQRDLAVVDPSFLIDLCVDQTVSGEKNLTREQRNWTIYKTSVLQKCTHKFSMCFKCTNISFFFHQRK